MGTLNISLPEDLRAVVEGQVAEGRFASHSEYIRHLIRQDQARIDREKLESLLLERLSGGEPVELTKAEWKRMREELLARLASKGKKGGRR